MLLTERYNPKTTTTATSNYCCCCYTYCYCCCYQQQLLLLLLHLLLLLLLPATAVPAATSTTTATATAYCYQQLPLLLLLHLLLLLLPATTAVAAATSATTATTISYCCCCCYIVGCSRQDDNSITISAIYTATDICCLSIATAIKYRKRHGLECHAYQQLSGAGYCLNLLLINRRHSVCKLPHCSAYPSVTVRRLLPQNV